MKADFEADGVMLFRGDSVALLDQLVLPPVDAVITDPPYSSGGFTHAARSAPPEQKYVSAGQKKTWPSFLGDNRDSLSWLVWSDVWASLAHRHCREAAYFLMFSDWRQLPLASIALQMGGFVWRGVIAWDKTEAARSPHKGYFRHQCEYVLWGSKGPLPANGGRGPWPGCLRHPVRQSDKHHMTGKPTDLMTDLVRVAPPGGVVLDPFMGSGTTGVAALRAGCQFVGIEMDPHYFEVAVARISAALAERSTNAS